MSARHVLLLFFLAAAQGQQALAQASDERVDYAALAQPAYADRLALTAAQRAEVANILQERVAALVEAAPAEREELLAESNRKLMQLLTDEQRHTFASLVAGGKLQFDFSQTQWPEVLDWFARQAGLALVMDQSPSGSFTYRDAKEYTPAEAIDLLNSVLLSKGFTLLRREKMLLVVDTSQGIPFELTPRVTVEELTNRGRFEIVTVEFPLEGRPVAQCVEAVQELIGKHGRVTPLTTAGKLLVTETAGKLQAINIVISSIPPPEPPAGPRPKPPAPVFAVHPATGLDPEATVETLKGLFAEATVRADPKAEEVHVYAVPALQSAIKASLEKMIANVTGENRPQLETYSIDADDLTTIQAQLERAVPEAQVTPDEANRRILVIAKPKQQAEVRDTLQKLGVAAFDPNDDETERPSVVIYQVEDDTTESLSQLLEEILPHASIVSQPGRIAVRGRPSDQALAKSTIDQFQRAADEHQRPSLRIHPLGRPLDSQVVAALKDAMPTATITLLDGGRRLAVVATPQQQEQLAATVKEIITKTASANNQTFKLYPLTKAQQKRLELVRQDLESELDIKLLVDADELAVWGTEAQHARFAQELRSLASGADAQDSTFERFPIDVASPNQLLSLLQDKFPRAQLQLNDAQDALLVWDNAGQMDLVRTELQKLTTALPKRAKKTLETYQIPASEASEILTAVQALVPAAQSRLDGSNRRLIAVGSVRDHAAIGELVQKLAPQDELASGVLISYELQHADPEAVVPMLAELRPDVRFAADLRANRVLVTAPLREHPRLQAVIQQLDAPPSANAKHVLKPYQLQRVNPAVVADLLQPLVPKMQLQIDEDSKRLVASGTEIDHQRLESIIRRIDGQESGQGQVRSYAVGTADPNQVRDVLLQLLPDAVISSNPESGRLLVWAAEPQQAVVQQAIEQFTGQAARASRELRTYPLPEGTGASALSFMEAVVPDAIASLDVAERTLICWATTDEHLLIKKAVDGLTDRAADRTVLSYSLEGVDSNLVQQLIAAEASEALVLDDTDPGRLYVQASADDHRNISSIIENLIQAGQGTKPTLRTHAVRPDVVRQVREYLTQSMDGLELLDDTHAESITCWATPEDHARVVELIGQFESELARPEPRTLGVYELRATSPSAVRTVLNESLEGLTYLNASSDSRLLCLATDEQHVQIKDTIDRLEDASQSPNSLLKVYPVNSQQITARIVADSIDADLTESISVRVNEETNSLIVRASEEDHARLRAAIDELVSQLPAAPKVEPRVYRLHKTNPSDALQVLEDLLPDARWAVNDDGGTLAATATPADHERIKEVIDQMDRPEPEVQFETQIYRFHKASAETARIAFQMLAPKARVAFDSDANAVIATATPADHRLLRESANLLDGKSEETSVQVYPLNIEQIKAADLVESLDGELRESAAIQVNETLNCLVVRASRSDQEQIRQAIDSIIEQLPATQKRTLKIYPLELASPEVVQEAIAPMIPNASVRGDEKTGSLLVNASELDHGIVSDVVDRLDNVSGQRPVMRVYPIRQGDGQRIYESLSQAFQNNGEFTITYQQPSATMFVIATPTNHAVFKEIVDKLDQPSSTTDRRDAKVYAIANTDGAAARSTLTTLFQGQRPEVQVEFDETGNVLLVVANERQHAEVAEALAEMEGRRRELEVFELQNTDPFVIETAVRDLFAQVPAGAAPSITSDYDTQKLFVRATQTQIEQIRQLLERMGEPILNDDRQSGDIRTIPFAGDTLKAARQIERIWPQLRTHRIQVITPSETGLQKTIEDPSLEEKRTPDNADEQTRTPARLQTHYVMQPSPPSEELEDAGQPTIVIVPEEGRITIASPDHAALDQIEALLRAMARSDVRGGSHSHFAVYLLKNTGAAETERLLGQLIEKLPMSRSGIGDIVVVADERLNALVVYGSRKDRQIVEELLRVLDTEQLPNPMVVHRPEIISLHHTQAVRIIEILRSVYVTQLTSGGGRKQVSIPEGVSNEVASVLQQINAAASGPLLTLDADTASNAIVMRAPPELSREIRAFVEQLDRHAVAAPNRCVRVIQLQYGKSDQIKEILNRFMLESAVE